MTDNEAERLLAEAMHAGMPSRWMRGSFNQAAWEFAAAAILAALDGEVVPRGTLAAVRKVMTAPVYEQPHTPRSEGGSGFLSQEFVDALVALRALLASGEPVEGGRK